MKKLHLSNKEKVIAGVCGGMYEVTGIDVSIIRIIFGASLFIGGAGAIAYIVLAFILPRDDEGEFSILDDENRSSATKIYRSWDKRIIAGVCGGLSDRFNFDVSIIRLIFIILLISGGIGIPFYIILWLVFPLEDQ